MTTIHLNNKVFILPFGLPTPSKKKYSDDFTDYIKSIPSIPFERKLKVNDNYYENKIGIDTESGWYKNGYTIKKKGRWLVIRSYTICNCKVCIDYTFTFKIKNSRYILKRVSGIKNSWVSTPKGKIFNCDTKEGWNESKKFCKNFFDEISW